MTVEEAKEIIRQVEAGELITDPDTLAYATALVSEDPKKDVPPPLTEESSSL